MLRVASVLRSTEVHPGLFSDLFASVSFSFLFSSAELHTRSSRLGVGAGGEGASLLWPNVLSKTRGHINMTCFVKEREV